MEIATNKRGKVLVVKPLETRLDVASAVDFKEKMADYIREGNQQIVLNISGVDFIDSSGLGAIVTSLKLQQQEGTIAICGVRETIKSMFKLTRMDRIFQIYEHEDEAVEVMKKNNLFSWT
ncbi:STAS domain-containing protein [bacterium]|nr:STAS domain-containing protein [bacterium]